ncbi:MAG: DUF5063 domain-containing protein [Bacteroidaceae bacterium]|nr:DUF5063 domain-containing protein [Bacteroidaceae bacterium]
MDSSVIFDKNVVEMVTVSAEYCTFLENSESCSQDHFIDVMSKMLPLLYLKASMLPEFDIDEDIDVKESVTEADYDYIREITARIISDQDDYLEVFVEEMRYSDTPIRKCISEDLADIYQALKNFVESFKSADNQIMTQSVAICRDGFAEYWGQTLANTLRAIHAAKFRQFSQPDAFED